MDNAELERCADQLLWSCADRERCRECGHTGRLTGAEHVMVVVDAFGDDTGLRAVAPVYDCGHGHVWHKGEGRKVGLDGILFAQQLRYRWRREYGSAHADHWFELEDRLVQTVGAVVIHDEVAASRAYAREYVRDQLIEENERLHRVQQRRRSTL